MFFKGKLVGDVLLYIACWQVHVNENGERRQKVLKNVKIQHEYSKEVCVFNWGSEMWDTRGRGGDKTANTTSITYRRV